MWAWRSLLRRPRPLLLSRLRPFRHSASQLTAALGRAGLIGSRGYASNSNSNGDPHDANRPKPAAATKRHLYVGLDDHRDGHGIHKLDLAADDLDGGTGRLPEPPVLRVALPTVRDDAQFAAVGSSIVAISTSITTDVEWQEVVVGGGLIYDTKTAAQVVSPNLPKCLLDAFGYRAAITVGDRLYLLESCGFERYYNTTSHKWTCLGDWRMPVVGHAHYDHGLDAWVGLDAVDDGYLCAGNVLSAPSEWKDGRDKLFCLDEDAAAGWSHVDTKLVPMSSPQGGGSEYCLMERLRPKRNGDRYKCFADGENSLLRLTSFCVERGEEGEPVVTARRRARSYNVSRYNEYFEAQAFWM
uniref:F-box/kelch-repeat protein n=1 Tax=Aegilops tauschii TaxID=37682 RepID=M8CNV0_AEGTA